MSKLRSSTVNDEGSPVSSNSNVIVGDELPFTSGHRMVGVTLAVEFLN